MFILLFGAVVNVVLNLMLIPLIGIEGASIATLFGYIISDIICVIVLCKMKLMVISKRLLLSTAITVCYFIVWRFTFSDKTLIGLIVAVISSCLLGLLYKKELKMIIDKFANKK